MLSFIRYISYPVKALGPGSRLALWFSGCKQSCEGCLSPKLKYRQLSDIRSTEFLCRCIEQLAELHEINGITISGGEPLLQLKAVAMICQAAKRSNINDILLFTGYRLEDIDKKHLTVLKNNVSVLVSGEYQYMKNDNDDKWGSLRGSSNQVIHFFDEKLMPLYEQYCSIGRQADVISQGTTFRIVGIPHESN